MLTLTLFTAGAWSAGAYHATVSRASRTAAARHVTVSAPATPDGSAWLRLPYPLIPPPDVASHRDLYGNDVSDAVAKYTSDRRGSLYEEHSPQTEVPRLKPPVG
jgi:hypothetical protein